LPNGGKGDYRWVRGMAMIHWATHAALTAVFAIAALGQILGAGHWVAAFGALGGEPVGRFATAALALAAVALYWWPGRRGYGAALMLALALGAVVAHLAVLGLSSAPPAAALAILAAQVLRGTRADFGR
jgi:putative oxidoreductase